MEIKDYKCKCGHNDFFFADKGSQKGIYCSYCGKWYKWADKDEQNLAMKQATKNNPTDYCRAFKIACELLNGSVLYGTDANRIFEIMMAKDGVVSNDSYESYILNNLQELDRGQYASEPTTKNDLRVDAVSRQAVKEQMIKYGFHAPDMTVTEFVEDLPPVNPQEPNIDRVEYGTDGNVYRLTISNGKEFGQKPKIGHWRDTGSGQECSECGEIQYGYDNFRHFCANCGAKMED